MAPCSRTPRQSPPGCRPHDVVPGDAVALMLPTGRAYFAAFCGTLLAGAICVPIYPPSRTGRIEEHVQRHLGILGNATRPRPDRARRRQSRWPACCRRSLPSLRLVATVEELSLRGDRPQPVVVAADDPALLQYTSGSTGAPKGVTLSHANLLANIRAMAEALHVAWRRRVRQLAAALPRHGADRCLARLAAPGDAAGADVAARLPRPAGPLAARHPPLSAAPSRAARTSRTSCCCGRSATRSCTSSTCRPGGWPSTAPSRSAPAPSNGSAPASPPPAFAAKR